MQVTRITSEALQAAIRRLLPSQQGFGEDLEASNVIIPVVDLTPDAEGAGLGTNLQTALSFDSQTAFNVNNATSTIINNAGFFRVFGTIGVAQVPSSSEAGNFRLTDGLSTKLVLSFNSFNLGTGTSEFTENNLYDFVVYLNAGESLTLQCTNGVSGIGSTRQIADVNGVLVNPAGYQPQ